jgi:predicted N-acyltransferase
MLVWKDFPDEDREALDPLAAGGRIFRIASYPGTSIALLPGGHSAFLATMRADRRHKIRAKLRKGKAALAVRASVASKPGEAALAEMWALFEQTRGRATTSFETLTPAFFRTIASREEASFVVLREVQTDRMVAFMLVLALGERAVNQFIGLDYTVAGKGYLYFQLFEAAYDWASGTGAKSLLSGQTGYMAKLDLGHALVPLWNYCEHRNWLVNAVFGRAGAAIAWETLDPQLAEYLRAHPEAGPAGPTARGRLEG